MGVCATCGTENPEVARFCLAYRKPLEPAAGPAPGDVRKVVTVLFSDVIGSTRLGERLDPESLRQVRALLRGDETSLEAHGGTVEKLAPPDRSGRRSAASQLSRCDP
jgi:class 3 adenylate cyclase